SQVEERRGEEARVASVVKGLKKRDIPTLDDEFAKDVSGKAQTMAELKDQLKADMAAHKKERAEGDQREKLLENLVEKNPVEAPPALVEHNVDAMLRGMLQGFQRSGLDISQLGVNVERLRDDLRVRATLEVKSFLILDTIAEKEGVKVTEQELDERIAKMAGETGQDAGKLKATYRRSGQLESIENRLRQDKAYALVLEKANLA
ncbi:MAG: hypothetical protein JST92_27190, partial [Deltaproteobacteria bacterium]|nr:hypothetical protein [Deltaproteobacteria bacterium]